MLQEKIKNFLYHHGIAFTPSFIKKIGKKNLETVADVMYYLPRKHEDRSSLLKLNEAIKKTQTDPLFITTIIAECAQVERFKFQTRSVLKYIFSDGINNFSIAAFNPTHRFKIGEAYILSGRLKIQYTEVQMLLSESEEFDAEAMQSLNSGRVVPIYKSVDGVSQKQLRRMINSLLETLTSEVKADTTNKSIGYEINQEILLKLEFSAKIKNIYNIHFPDSFASLEKARQQLAFEELYIMQRQLAEKAFATQNVKNTKTYSTQKSIEVLEKFLPFKLTEEQHTVTKEILADMQSSKAMNRLLQGEVGSGKTVVALQAMLVATENNIQAAFMAPTDVLAKQHFHYIKNVVLQTGLDVKVHLLVSQQTEAERKITLLALQNNANLIVVGTHSLIQEKVLYKNLGLVIIDEQHRFGVEQREALKEKTEHPERIDFLSLSATPIPRSLSLTLFGDMQRSELRLRAAAKTDVKCKFILEKSRPHAYQFLCARIKAGEQGFVVFPVIEESASGKLKSLLKEYEHLKKIVFRGVPTAFVHGKMLAAERDELMEAFRAGKIKTLFCTTVLEVGIDCPNASVIIIESAAQFGLSQLHQLRGRVGRHDKPGYCYLVGKDDLAEEVKKKLQRFAATTSGFEIAEIDLQTRGPGEMAGVRQSGFLQFRFADLQKDFKLLLKARKLAFGWVFKTDKSLPL